MDGVSEAVVYHGKPSVLPADLDGTTAGPSCGRAGQNRRTASRRVPSLNSQHGCGTCSRKGRKKITADYPPPWPLPPHRSSRKPRRGLQPANAVAVLPFTYLSQEAADVEIGTAVAQELSDRLATIEAVTLVPSIDGVS